MGPSMPKDKLEGCEKLILILGMQNYKKFIEYDLWRKTEEAGNVHCEGDKVVMWKQSSSI